MDRPRPVEFFVQILIQLLFVHRIPRDWTIYAVSYIDNAVSVIVRFLYHFSQAAVYNAIPGSLYRVSVSVRNPLEVFLCLLK